MPFLDGLSHHQIAGTVAAVTSTQGAVALQYGSGQGAIGLRQQIIEETLVELADAGRTVRRV